jgi:hypothetical protein
MSRIVIVILIHHRHKPIDFIPLIIIKKRGRIESWSPVLQDGRSRIRFPIKYLDFSVDLIFQPHCGPGLNSASKRK